jgi:hypothetical protein
VVVEVVVVVVVGIVIGIVIIGKRRTGSKAGSREARDGDAHPAVFAVGVFVEGCLAHCDVSLRWGAAGIKVVMFKFYFRLSKGMRYGGIKIW